MGSPEKKIVGKEAALAHVAAWYKKHRRVVIASGIVALGGFILFARCMAHKQEEDCQAAMESLASRVAAGDANTIRTGIKAARDVCKSLHGRDIAEAEAALAKQEAAAKAAAKAVANETAPTGSSPASPVPPASATTTSKKEAREVLAEIQVSKKEAQEMLAAVRALEQEGRSMGYLRDAYNLPEGEPYKLDKLRRCGERMRELQPKARELRQRTDRLPVSLVYLRVAATQLELCVSCSVTLAPQNCDGARDDLREASAAVAKMTP
jgi:ribosomal protein L22